MVKVATAALFLVASTFYFIYGFRYSFYTPDGRFGSGSFPRLVGASLVFLSLANVVWEVRQRQPDESNAYWGDIGIITAMLVGFIVSLGLVGTVPSIFLLVLAVLALLNSGHWVLNVSIAVGLAAFIHFLFRVWLNAALPMGRFSIPWLS